MVAAFILSSHSIESWIAQKWIMWKSYHHNFSPYIIHRVTDPPFFPFFDIKSEVASYLLCTQISWQMEHLWWPQRHNHFLQGTIYSSSPFQCDPCIEIWVKWPGKGFYYHAFHPFCIHNGLISTWRPLESSSVCTWVEGRKLFPCPSH